jgi:hypothetical protein
MVPIEMTGDVGGEFNRLCFTRNEFAVLAYLPTVKL